MQIGLDNAPKIMAAAGDYAAARQRVNEALSALLPPPSGQIKAGSEASQGKDYIRCR